ncbi:MAG: Na+/H+ antiporter [Chloroflexi bacterium]|nr:Na+/H+ antiporter [Chloroflexota bacterium]
MQEFINTETLIIELLLIASLVAIAVRRLRIPYTVALVVVGLILTAQSTVKFSLTPELILALFVPPLVFEAAFNLNLSELRRNFGFVLVLAVPGVVLTMLIVGGILTLTISLALPVAMVFGALIAATDPVAVVALFRILRVPKRLRVLVEGESLLNDGTALVLFNLSVAVVISGSFSFFGSIVDFLRISIGGIVLGLILGWLFSRLIARIDDYLIEITLTTVLAYGAYLLAEQFHVSGLLAVVAAGLITGSLGPQGMSPTTRIVLSNFWEYITFLVNSLVFLLIGLQVDIKALIVHWQAIAWAIGAVLFARVIVIYGLGWITGRLSEPISLRWRHVLAWGGLRGALSLALALSLPISFGDNRELILTMAFGVALFTLIIQATSMRPLLNRLGIVTVDALQIDYEQRQARLTALRSAESHMERRHREGLISSLVWEKIRPEMQEQSALLAEDMRELLRVEPGLETEELETALREVLRSQRSAYLGLRKDGVISEETFEKLSTEVDATLEQGIKPNWLHHKGPISQRLKEALNNNEIVKEIVVELGSICDGSKVKEVSWPNHFVIASLRHGVERIIPKGDTLISSGDVLTVLGTSEALFEVHHLCEKKKPS